MDVESHHRSARDLPNYARNVEHPVPLPVRTAGPAPNAAAATASYSPTRTFDDISGVGEEDPVELLERELGATVVDEPDPADIPTDDDEQRWSARLEDDQ